MKKLFYAVAVAALLMSCGQGKEAGNPFMAEYDTPFQVPPFEQIKLEHYKPAFLQGMEEQTTEVAAIVNNPDAPTFENTIVALDQSGSLLLRVSTVFYVLNSANTNKEMQDLSREISPLSSTHYDDINLNPELFARVKVVY